ncbi:hypothetical protein GCM10028778_09670 [Barrientosiimonas marina]|uniref:Competence type IV pilus minor pilin ComGD n=1 Tax=Lentibacillus kimchii TaxID=1542911 RepID=A0ABW2UVZ5_9BACI
MARNNGFTLIEVLFVLSILSVLVVISAPLHISVLDKQTEQRFLETLDMDILHLQSLAYNTRDYYRLTFEENRYFIDKNSATILERELPEGWQIKTRKLKNIAFKHTGTIRQPGNLTIKTLSNSYKLTCPLGKGRCYVAKQ